MVVVRIPERENECNSLFKRPRVYAVRDFPKGCGTFVARLQPSEYEGDEDMNILLRKNLPLPSPRLNVGHMKSLVRDKESKQHAVGHSLSAASVVDKAQIRVKKALAEYKEILTELGRECDANSNKRGNLYVDAAMYLKHKNKWINRQKRIGEVPGVKVGDKFQYRTELAIVGLHLPYQCGIDYMTEKGEIIATSVVESGRYANKRRSSDVMIYTGQGGNPNVSKGKPKDQEATRGNRALMNSNAARIPVRVIFSYKSCEESGYVYDGLYTVDKYWQERGEKGKFEFRFELRRIFDKP